MQVNASQIENALYDAYGPRWVSTIYGSVNEYKVLLELMPKYQADPRALSLLYFKSPAGKLIPLDTLAQVEPKPARRPSITTDSFLPPPLLQSRSPAPRSARPSPRSQDIAAASCPPPSAPQFQGAAKAFQSSLGNLWVLLIIAIMVVYIVLGILYESYIHPLTILSGLPSAGFGALMTLVVFHIDLNIYAFVGLIMLIGIVEKNAIMQIDFALEAERHQGLPPDRRHLRRLPDPLPAHHDDHHGGAARRGADRARLWRRRRSPPARSDWSVVGGLLFSQLVTLYLTPVFYTYMAALQEWTHSLRKRKHLPAEAPVTG